MKNGFTRLKELVHPKNWISPLCTYPQGILGVYDFPFSGQCNQLYKNCSGFFKLYNAMGGCFSSSVQNKANKAHPSTIKKCLT